MPSRPRSDVFPAVISLDRLWKLSASLLSVSICCVKDWDFPDTSMLDKNICAHENVNYCEKKTNKSSIQL